MRPEHVTRTPTNGSAVLLSFVSPSVSCDTDVYLTYIGYGIILTAVVCQFLETGTSHRCLIVIVNFLRFSGFSLSPLFIFHSQSL